MLKGKQKTNKQTNRLKETEQTPKPQAMWLGKGLDLDGDGYYTVYPMNTEKKTTKLYTLKW